MLAVPLMLADASTIAMAQTAPATLDTETAARLDAQSQLTASLARIAEDGSDWQSLTQAGRAALVLGDPRAALGFLARAEALAPRDPIIKAALGATMVQLEDPAQALRYFEAAIAAGGLERSYLGDRGLAFDLLGDQTRAQADYVVAEATAPSAELTRRHAISLGISGREDDAVRLLAPLLRAQDRAAWRSRAMIVAMNGDADEARQIARATMPPELATALDPYFALMDRLSPAQLAAAATFGRFPEYEVVRAQPSRSAAAQAQAQAQARVAAATVTPPASAARDRSRSARATDRDRDRNVRDRGRRTVAVATPPPAPAPRATPPAPATAPIASAPRPPQAAPARVVPTPAPTPAPAAAPAPTPTSTSTPTPAPARVAAVPVSPPATPPVVYAANPVVQPVPASGGLVGSAADARPAFTAWPQVGSQASASASAAPAGASETLAQAQIAANAAAAGLVVPQPAAPAPDTAVVAGWSIDSMVASIVIPDAERAASAEALSLAEIEAIARERRAAMAAEAAATRARQQADARTRAAAEAAARERAAAEAAARAEAELRRRHPARTWVQVATGADVSALGFDCRRLTRQYAASFEGKSCSSAVWNRTRRLVVGPFPNATAARTWLSTYSRAGGDGFVWSSDVGEEVTPIGRGR